MSEAEPAKVRTETDGDVAVVVIDNPPVNAGSTAVRRGLLEAIRSAEERADIGSVVLIGAGGNFIAGSDIKEFDKPLEEPQLPSVIAAIESCPKPVVAAIRGAAFGGGLEVALGCDARIATRDAQVGLPEVKLGLIPGAGGTQRTPRLTGIAAAIEMIASGRRIPAEEALTMGLVDAVVDGDLRGAALSKARELKGKRRIADMPAPTGDAAAIEAAASEAVRRSRGVKAVGEAVAAVRMAGDTPFREALAKEREIFQRLRTGEESAALRHLFFAERRALRAPRDVKPRAVERVGVVGLGLMGSGIAASFAAAGFDVLVAEQNEDALAAGTERTREVVQRIAKRGGFSPEALDQALARVQPVEGLNELAPAELVIEAVIEEMGVKEAIFRKLDTILAPGAILASNTSYLDINAMAAAMSRPSDFAGFHFFSPPHAMRLVEVVRGAETARDVVATLVGLARRIGKLPVIAGASEGFIGNRILSAYRQQCDFLLEEGAYPEDVDAALTSFGLAMGPYAVSDLAGLDISWQMRKRRAASRDQRARYFPAADRLCEMGRFGRKTKAGWYRYGEDARTPQPDPEIQRLIDYLSAEAGVRRRKIKAAEILERVMAAMVNEACAILHEGIAERPSDIDLVLVNGYGFPATKGGPLFWASRRPRAEMLAAVARMVEASGFGATQAPNINDVLDSAGG